MRRALVVALAMGVLATGCSDDGSTSIVEADVEGNRVLITIDSCTGSEADIEVTEADDEVRIRAQTHGENVGDCLDGGTVELQQPLGDRRLVDDRTGMEIPVTG